MADWCSLPAELLYSISLLLPTTTDVLRFRSICVHWRSAAVNPIITCSGFSKIKGCDLSLTKRTIYALQSTTLPSVSWIIKLEQDNINNNMHPLHPLSEYHKEPLPGSFPKSFCFMNSRVKELGQEYTLRTIPSVVSNSVAVLNCSGDGFVILAIEKYRLVVYKSGGYKRRLKEDTVSFYDDVIVREGMFYAVNNCGGLVLVDHVNMKVHKVTNWIGYGMKKFLVDCDGELLLVDMGWPYWQRKFKVYRFDENTGEGIEVRDLGDRVLFVGDHRAFSASASDIFGGENCEENRIFFMDHFRIRKDDEAWNGFGVGVFDLESGSIEPLGSYPGYSMVFWPPRNWDNSVGTC